MDSHPSQFSTEGESHRRHNTQATNCGEELEISPKEPANASPRSTAGEEPEGRGGEERRKGGQGDLNEIENKLSSLLIPPGPCISPAATTRRTNSVLTTWY